jgi:hypothetical protein
LEHPDEHWRAGALPTAVSNLVAILVAILSLGGAAAIDRMITLAAQDGVSAVSRDRHLRRA